MSIYGWTRGTGASGFGYNSTAEEVTAGVDLRGQTWLVTGVSSGLGAETMRVLLNRGARVLAAARSEQSARDAARGLSGEVVPVACELSEPASVRSAVAAVRADGHELAGLIANAGIMALPERTVKHGLELQFLTNHMGHFSLVTGLLDRLAPTARVVLLSSSAHRRTYPEGIRLDDLAAERGYTPWGAYGQSKLANMLFARHLAKRLPAGQTANSVHPGVIATNLARHLNPALRGLMQTIGPVLALKSIPQGAATQCYVAVHPAAARTSGEFFADNNVAVSTPHGRDDGLAAALWERSEQLLAAL